MPGIDQKKRKVVSDIIRQLHQGLSTEEARERIVREVGILTSSDITQIEQSLIDEGVSPDEIKRFCNVHALLFQSTLQQSVATPESPEHPVNLLRQENREIEKMLAELKQAASELAGPAGERARETARGCLEKLRGLDGHYSLKENALFPYLEKHGFLGPSKVMWGKHNEVRELLKRASDSMAPDSIAAFVAEAEGMIFKEENILFPSALEMIGVQEWVEILKACDEIGYPYLRRDAMRSTLIELEKLERQAGTLGSGEIALPSGRFTLTELSSLLDTLPLDITFVDADDRVKYFSQGGHRIFVRAKSILGRAVANCHPPQSVQRVMDILEAFRNGSRDHADFWIKLRDKLVYIRYFAVRDPDGKYLGTLEATQDITGIRALEGEKRLLEDTG